VCVVAKFHPIQVRTRLLREELLEYTGMYARTSIEHVGSPPHLQVFGMLFIMSIN
jgi:hypothetical protein